MNRLESKFIHHIKTPLLKGKKINDTQIYYKLDNLQPSGSFKDRGIGHMINTLVKTGKVNHLVTSSGGNAGHSVACCGERLGIPVTCFVPTTTSQYMIDKIKSRGTNIVIGGANWNEADAKAKELLAKEKDAAAYIPPFDNPLIWAGNSTIIDEIKEDMNEVPDAVALSVGGGGLLVGCQQGIERHNWKTKIFALETEGAASFAAAKKAQKVVSLEKIDSIATTLGALAVTPAALISSVFTESLICTDKDAVEACLKFAHEERILVEPACGAALSLLDSSNSNKKLLQGLKSLVVIVCGGSAVNLDLLAIWKKRFDIM